MKKKSYQKPLMVSEEFVPQEYVAACSPDISWQPKPNATPYSSDSHFWIDKNNNGILDTNEQINSNRYTCDNSGALPNGEKVNMFLKTQVKNAYSLIRPKEILSLFIN